MLLSEKTFSTAVPCCCWSFGLKIKPEIIEQRGLKDHAPIWRICFSSGKSRRSAWNICQEAGFPPRWLFCLSTVGNQSRQRCWKKPERSVRSAGRNSDLLVVFINVKWPEHTLTTWGGLMRAAAAPQTTGFTLETAKVSLCSRKNRIYKSNQAVELGGPINSQHCIRPLSLPMKTNLFKIEKKNLMLW